MAKRTKLDGYPGAFVKEIEPPKPPVELPVLTGWECGSCGCLIVSVEQPEACENCGVEFWWQKGA